MAKMSDHTHDHVGEFLDRYRTGELGEPDRLRIERHLEMCESCRGELEALAAFARVVERGYAAERAARAAEREPDWPRLRASIVERTSGRTSGARRARLARFVPQAALAVLALVALGVLWEQGVRGPGDAEQALRSERRAANGADGEDTGGPAATAGADREERAARNDRFDVPIGAPETREPMEEAPPESPDEANERRRGAALDDAGFRGDVDGVERDADRAVEGAPADEAVAEAAAPVGQAEDRAAAGARPDAAQAREEVAKAAAAPPPELERFQTAARTALSEADTLRAARALAQWRDSLAPRRDLPPALERAARALADSLAAFLATRP